jgi:UDP-N-acetylglucosamine--N-acetylmuramyl-(pentapeptide) pyrophosphoryl-undecaprenol N-acetylglucosamine transferase
VFPALALARHLAEGGAEVRFAGTSTGQEARLVPDAGFAFVQIEAKPLVRAASVRALIAPLSTIRSVARCRPIVEAADVVVGMGGYVSVPVALAALRARKPLVLHEQNAVPGLANRALARPARTVALSFADAARRLPRSVTTVVTGNPVRPEILAVRAQRDTLRKEALVELDLDEARRTVVVFGGSQGALHVNRAIIEALAALADRRDLQVVLLTGPAHLEGIRSSLPSSGSLLVRPLGFLERMELAYALADLVVSRAGATTIAELAVCGIPSILVPYPYATGRHQEANARALQRAGAADVVLDDAISGRVFAARIAALLDDAARLRAMGECAAGWSRPDAAEALAAVVRGAGAG